MMDPRFKSRGVHRGMSLADAKTLARRRGATVEPIHRTGELRFYHPRLGALGAVNARRKDAPRRLVVWLRRLTALTFPHLLN